MGVLARLRKFVAGLGNSKRRGLELAAREIEAKLVSDATTKRGNVPSFGRLGDVKIRAVPSENGVNVTAAEWVMDIAHRRGQPREWAQIVARALSGEIGGGR
jgi:hypothetical protein